MALAASSANYCCNRLFAALASKVSFPGNNTYASTESSYWSLQEATLTPSCIATPYNTEDAVKIISIIADIPDCQAAVKGQGHAPAAGFANINQGVTIDTTHLNSTTLNADASVINVGAGCSWSNVYDYLNSFGLTAAGGRNGAVGVGGLTLGGGISYFSPRIGFVCDTVLNFEVVLSSGICVNANATSNPSLFKALKGGSNNLGLVTRIDLPTIPQSTILAGNVVAESISQIGAYLKAFGDIANATSYDEYASLVTGLTFNSTSKEWSLVTTAAYTKPGANNTTTPAVYQELFSIPSAANTVAVVNISTLAAESPIPAFNWLFLTGTYSASSSLLDQIFTICNTTLYDFVPAGTLLWSIAFEPLPTIFTSRGARTNVLGSSAADGNGVVLLLSALWTNSSSSKAINDKACALLAAIDAAAEERGMLHRFRYANYAGPGQRPLRSYGEQDFEFLRRVSRQYDVKGVFQKQVIGGFKLW